MNAATHTLADTLTHLRAHCQLPPFTGFQLSPRMIRNDRPDDYTRLAEIARHAHGDTALEILVQNWARTWNAHCRRIMIGSIQQESFNLLQPYACRRTPATEYFFAEHGSPSWHLRVQELTAIVKILSGLPDFVDDLAVPRRQLKSNNHGS